MNKRYNKIFIKYEIYNKYLINMRYNRIFNEKSCNQTYNK